MTTMILAAQAAQGGGSMSFLVLMVAIFVIMYFTMMRPQQKRQKQIRNFQNSLQQGTEVVTQGGIHGTIRSVSMEKGTVEVDIARGVTITVEKSCVFESAPQPQA